MTGVRRVPLLLLTLLAAWLLAGVVTAAPAAAHAELVRTVPADGARLTTPPDEVTLEFSESVSLGAGYARVLDAGGERVDAGAPTADGDLVRIPLRSHLPEGGYLVIYRVISADSHPISGGFSFVVGEGELLSTAGADAGAGGDPVVGVALPAARWLGFAGLALAVGVPAFAALCWPAGWAVARLRRLATWGAVAVAVSAVLTFLLQGPYAAGSGLGALLDPALLLATLQSETGWALLVRLVLAGALAATLRPAWRRQEAPDVPQLAAAGVFAVGLVGSVAAVGHPVAGPWPGLAIAVIFVHVAAMALWLGGLAALAAGLLRASGEEISAALPRFSRLAFSAVTALVVSGVVQAVREVGSPTALVSTTYGRVLLAKLVLVLAALAAAGVSRVWVQQRLGVRTSRPRSRRQVTAHAFAATDTSADDLPADDAGAVRSRAVAEGAEEHVASLRRSVLVELVLAAAILALSAVLVATPPARATVAQPVDVTVPLQGSSGPQGTAQISVDPARPGPNTLHVYLFDDSGRLTQPDAIRVTLTESRQSIGPLEVDLQPGGPGHYVGDGMLIPRPGTWTLTVTARMDEFTSLTASTTFPVR